MLMMHISGHLDVKVILLSLIIWRIHNYLSVGPISCDKTET